MVYMMSLFTSINIHQLYLYIILNHNVIINKADVNVNIYINLVIQHTTRSKHTTFQYGNITDINFLHPIALSV